MHVKLAAHSSWAAHLYLLTTDFWSGLNFTGIEIKIYLDLSSFCYFSVPNRTSQRCSCAQKSRPGTTPKRLFLGVFCLLNFLRMGEEASHLLPKTSGYCVGFAPRSFYSHVLRSYQQVPPLAFWESCFQLDHWDLRDNWCLHPRIFNSKLCSSEHHMEMFLMAIVLSSSTWISLLKPVWVQG